jgi:hypothetical protein
VPQRDDIGPVDPQGMERMLAEYYQIRGWDEKGGSDSGAVEGVAAGVTVRAESQAPRASCATDWLAPPRAATV